MVNRWKASERMRAAHYRSAQRIFKRSLIEQFKPVIDYVNLMGGSLTIEDAVDMINRGAVQDAYEYVYQTTGGDFAKSEFAKFAGATNDAMKQQFDDFFAEYVRTGAAKRVTSITNVSKKYARKIISNTIADNPEVGTDKLGRLISQALNKEGGKISAWRARVIARTEVVTASNLGQQVGAEAIGQDMMKTWLSTADDRIRDAHLMADGQTVGLKEDFIVGGERMSVPGDARGSAGNTVNCRCAVTYEVI